ncbi:MAG: quinolinate synthase NadA [Candidatus Hydrogenedentes bacterium]|nr:quinolinate synthase NadA [Candidatus Hydrogenedentota bacterium]
MQNAVTIARAPSFEATLRMMQARLKGVVPPFEIEMKAEIAHKINLLKKELNAVILGHNYMEPALFHSVPDYTGDSLYLSAVSAQTDADIIVFCGVWFMGETAKILNPSKTVLVPSTKAGCSLAAGISAKDVAALRLMYPGAPVVSYVNTYAEVKAVSDYCCTSGNASKVLKHLLDEGHKRIIFLPDEFLARNTAAEMEVPFIQAGQPIDTVPLDQPAVIGWHVRCEVHELFTVDDVHAIRRQYPDAVILAHPECSPEVIEAVDVAGSTKMMTDYVEKVDKPRYALLTECSMGDNLAAQFPHREMVRACSLRCQHMNQITLEDTLAALEKIQYKVELPPDIIEQARKPIERMLALR